MTTTMTVEEINAVLEPFRWEVHPAYVKSEATFPRDKLEALRKRLLASDAAGEDDLVLYPSGDILPGYWAFVGKGIVIARSGLYRAERITAYRLDHLLRPFGWHVSPSDIDLEDEVVTYNIRTFNRSVVAGVLGLAAAGHTIAYVSLATGRVTADAHGAQPMVRIVADPIGEVTTSMEYALTLTI